MAKACAYVDTKNYEKGKSGVPEVKAAYKLPFAKIKNGKMTIFKRGVIAAMQALLGARGGAKIPRDEKKTVYNKLAELYKKFDMEPPKFHFKEVESMDFEEKIKTLEEQVKELSEEKENLLKELEDVKKEKAELEKKMMLAELDNWEKDWINKGVAPAVVKKFKDLAMENPEKTKKFDEILETFADPKKMKQMGEEDTDNPLIKELKKADKVAETVYGGDE